MPDVAALHRGLVDELVARGWIRSPAVEAAFRTVPRHLFLPGLAVEEVYRDQVIITKRVDGEAVSSSSQPQIMAVMLEQLGLEAGHRALEIGAGTGYNAGLMAHIVGERGQVTTVDIDAELVADARKHLEAAGCHRVRVVCADGGFGHSEGAPYDRIILTVSALGSRASLVRAAGTSGTAGPAPHDRRDPEVRGLRPGRRTSGKRLGEGMPVHAAAWCLRPASAPPPARPTGSRSVAARDHAIDAALFCAMLRGAGRPSPVTCASPAARPTVGSSRGSPSTSRDSAGSSRRARTRTRASCPACSPAPGSSGPRRGWSTTPPRASSARGADMASDPFDLTLRAYGDSTTLVSRVRTRVAEWEAAGRPGTQGLRIRAYPIDGGV